MYIWILVFFTFSVSAQKIDAFAKASSSKKKVLLEQGFRVKVKAYSSTWFAKPLVFDNIQMEGAFVQSFKRTLSSMETVNKKKYASLEFYYIVFPYQTGELTFPALEIKASIPPEGDYKGQDIILRTEALSILVENIPKGYDEERWMVANDVRLKNSWSEDINTLKIGDVLIRKITTNANGTLPSFIDAPEVMEVDFASLYSQEPEFTDLRDDKSVNGKRLDTYSYLLEEEGEFIIPALEISWYNPALGKFYKRELPEYQIKVSSNPELASLHQLRDSLNALNPIFNQELTETEEVFEWKTWFRYGVYLIILIFVLFGVWKVVKRVKNHVHLKKIAYQNSEAFWFDKMMKQKDEKSLLVQLYFWLNRTHLTADEKTISHLAKDDQDYAKETEKLKSSFFDSSKNTRGDVKKIKAKTQEWRLEQKKKSEKKVSKNELQNLNP